MSGLSMLDRGPLPQYRTKGTGAPTSIDLEILCNIARELSGCSGLKAHVLKDCRPFSGVISICRGVSRFAISADRPDIAPTIFSFSKPRKQAVLVASAAKPHSFERVTNLEWLSDIGSQLDMAW